MDIQVRTLKELRDLTGAGIMDCKRVIEAAAGDIEKAAASLRELAAARAKEREERAANEGRVFLRVDGNRAALVNLACETDFVAKNEAFIRLGESCLDAALAGKGGDPARDMEGPIGEAAMRIRERIALRGVKVIEAGPGEALRGYLHGEGRIGAVVRLRAGAGALLSATAVSALAADLALHAAAYAPSRLSRADVDTETVNAWKAEYEREAADSGKSDAIVDAIVRGRLEKTFKRMCFLDQPFIRDESKSVADAIRAVSEASGAELSLTGFIYASVAEETAAERG